MGKTRTKRPIRSQLSGKLSEEDAGLFVLKRKLIKAGIDIQFPFGNKIIGEHKGIPVTFTPSRRRSFYEVELAFFEAIRHNPVHIIHNKYGGSRGYVGESASIEIAYAILHHKPIVLLYKPTYSDSVPLSVSKLIRANSCHFTIERIDLLKGEELYACISQAIENFQRQYDLCDVATEISVMGSIVDLFESYRSQ